MNSLQYRKSRMKQLSQSWGMKRVNDLFTEWEIPPQLYSSLVKSVCLYVSKAFHFENSDNEEIFLSRLDASRNFRRNVKPNGGIVPKREYAVEYNLFIRSWCDIVRHMVKKEPEKLKKFRLTPNVRVKFGNELEENIGRGLDTALPHSDSWVEGPWGMNCHVPILGDTEKNYLHFYRLKDESLFQDNFLETSAKYTDMQWVVSYYEDDVIVPKRNFVSISDYALIHKTRRVKNAGTRISIDTTVFAGDHDVHPDRASEYLSRIPRVGEDLFIQCLASENEDFSDKKTVFSHYTSGTLRHVWL